MQDTLPPAVYAIQVFGGIRALARDLGVEPSTVWRWKMPRDQGGSDGEIPSWHQAELLRLARERGLDLTSEDLVVGRAVTAPAVA